MRKWTFYTLTLITFCFIQAFANATPYTISDLEYLEKERNTYEFLEHAKDIRPHLRNKHYQEMLEHMGMLHLKNLLAKKSFKTKDFHFIESISQWPILKKDPFFQSKRNHYMKNFFQHCSLKKGQCQEKLFSFWNHSSKDPDLGLYLATLLTREKTNQSKEYSELFLNATRSKVSEFLCKKKIIIQFSLRRVPKISQLNPEDKVFLQEVEKDFNKDCLPHLFTTFKKIIFTERPSYKQHLFRFLSLHKQLSEGQKQLYLLEVFLSAPAPSKELNLAWNSLRRLGQAHLQRQKLLRLLKERDFLPGYLFKFKEKSKKAIFLKFLSANFPEYIDLYTQTCLRYMSGQKKFPLGNPTLYCQNLFNQHSRILNKKHLAQYKKIIL